MRIHRWISLQRANNARFICFRCCHLEQTIEWTVELSVICFRCCHLEQSIEWTVELSVMLSERLGVWNHRQLQYLFNHLFMRTSKRLSKPVLFVRGIRWPVHSFQKRPLTQKIFPFYDVITRRSSKCIQSVFLFLMTSSNGSIFRVTGHLCGEFTDPRWIPHTKGR